MRLDKEHTSDEKKLFWIKIYIYFFYSISLKQFWNFQIQSIALIIIWTEPGIC